MENRVYKTELRLNLSKPLPRTTYNYIKERTSSHENKPAEYRSISEYIQACVCAFETQKQERNLSVCNEIDEATLLKSIGKIIYR